MHEEGELEWCRKLARKSHKLLVQKSDRESEWWKKNSNADKAESGRTKSGNRQRLHYVEGTSGGVVQRKFYEDDHLEAKRGVYVDSNASNHMTNYDEWFSYLEKPKIVGVLRSKINMGRIR